MIKMLFLVSLVVQIKIEKQWRFYFIGMLLLLCSSIV